MSHEEQQAGWRRAEAESNVAEGCFELALPEVLGLLRALARWQRALVPKTWGLDMAAVLRGTLHAARSAGNGAQA